ncbi:BZ3500_MvSof-1268-A1-R1_Chr4-2g06951 [Microbotryum saponariae]|uniref:Defective in cullin neddylation protein n=1 Tax=Microbotryum saponariae TaxID=289078 RepID=A0A2X0MWE1_9BASI|nr:BZ3500_MvSof-1268-A1-R1_Chr4-2g06951 [Microbotryum saponariae]SDA06616.1 BZ3501_MvSof-1269-A2-R1_Chr4-2g06662 [Microbotryum saponariae]
MVQEPPVKRPSTRSSKAFATADPSTSTSATASTSSGASSSKKTPTAATKANTTTSTATKATTSSTSKIETKRKSAEVEPFASTSSSKTKTATTVSKKVVLKTATKPIEQVELDDLQRDVTSDSGDSSVVIEAPAPKVTKSTGKKAKEPIKKSTKAVKTATASSSKSASKIGTTKFTSKKVGAQLTEDIQVHTTSTPSPASAKKPSKTAKSAKVTAVLLNWDKQCKTWFAEYASEDDPELINFDGIQTLFEHMDISLADVGVLTDVTALVLSWKLKAPTFGSYSLADWQRTFCRDSVKSTYELKKWLLDVEKTLWPEKPSERSDAQLHEFYLFLFSYMMPEGQKTLPGDVALTIWDLVLARRFETGRAIVRYGQFFAEETLRGVSKDLYHQVWEFATMVTPDLKGWSEEDAWPSTIDSFVEWQQKQLKGE